MMDHFYPTFRTFFFILAALFMAETAAWSAGSTESASLQTRRNSAKSGIAREWGISPAPTAASRLAIQAEPVSANLEVPELWNERGELKTGREFIDVLTGIARQIGSRDAMDFRTTKESVLEEEKRLFDVVSRKNGDAPRSAHEHFQQLMEFVTIAQNEQLSKQVRMKALLGASWATIRLNKKNHKIQLQDKYTIAMEFVLAGLKQTREGRDLNDALWLTSGILLFDFYHQKSVNPTELDPILEEILGILSKESFEEYVRTTNKSSRIESLERRRIWRVASVSFFQSRTWSNRYLERELGVSVKSKPALPIGPQISEKGWSSFIRTLSVLRKFYEEFAESKSDIVHWIPEMWSEVEKEIIDAKPSLEKWVEEAGPEFLATATNGDQLDAVEGILDSMEGILVPKDPINADRLVNQMREAITARRAGARLSGRVPVAVRLQVHSANSPVIYV